MRSSRFSWCCCRCDRSYSWCVSCRSFGSILIFTNNCYSWCSSSKWFLRNKGYSSVRCYCVSTNAIYCLSSWTIIEGCWNVIVHWHTAVAFSKFRLTCLSLTLFTSRCCIFRSRCYWCHSWCVSRWSFGSVLIFTNNSYSWCCSSKWFLWDESYGSVCCHCVSTNAVNSLGSWAIIKCCWNIIIDFYRFLNAINCYGSTLEFRFTCLSSTLNIRCFSWCSCWGYWNNFRCVGCIHLDAIWAFSLNLNRRYLTCIRFISWCEGHLSSCWINWVRTDFSCTIFSIGWRSRHFITIFVQKCVAIIFDCNSFILTIYLNSCTFKGWCSSLCRTLDIFRCSWFSCWNSCYNCWCVTCIWSDGWSLTIFICNRRYCLNFHASCSSDKVFFRSKGYCSGSRIDCVSTFTCYCYSCFICWLTCCRVNQFLTCNLSSLIITQSKCWSFSLRNILNVFRNFICWSKSDWINSWCVSCRCFSSVLIFTNYCYSWCSTSKAWFWNKCYSSVCSYCISTNAINSLRSRSIIEGCWNVIIHWYTVITFSEGWFARLGCTLNTCCFSWCRSWCYRCNCWCVSRRSFGSVLIFTNNSYSRCSSNKWFFWYKGYCTVCCHCVSTNTIYSLRSWSIIKCCWNSVVHRHTAIAFSEFRFACLGCPLDVCWFSWCSCWGYWCHSWCVFSCDFSTVLINTFHCYAWSSSSEWFFWDESYGSIWRNSVCTFSIYCLSRWTIFEGSWCILINWNIWIAFREGWFTCLSLTLDISWCSIFRCWNNWSNLRCVSCFYCCTVSIRSLNLNWDNIAGIRFIRWCEGHNTCIFINGEGTNFFTFWWLSNYRCCWLTIFIKKSNGILVDWCYFITFSEGYCTCLNQTLRSSRFSRCCSWSYWSYSWCVSYRSFCSVLIFTNNCYGWCFTCEWFFRDECNCTVWSHRVSTNAIDCLGSWTIIKSSWNVIIHWHTAVAFSKFRLTCLGLSLFTCRCCIFCSRCYWGYCWCICRRSFSTVHVFTNNRHCWCCSSKWFLRNEGYGSVCCHCVSTNAVNSLSRWAIVKCCSNIIIHRHTAITLSKYRFTSLCSTLDICSFNWCCRWSYWSHSWCISCRGFGSVLIFTNNRHCWCSSNEWFFRYECNCSVCCYCVSTNAVNCLSRWTIIEGRWNSFINRYCFLNAIYCYSSALKFRFTSLRCTLDIFCFSWCCCRCYWNDFRCVCCIHLDTVWTFRLNLGWSYHTCVWFISRCESDLTSSWIDRVSTDFSCTISSISWCTCHFIAIIIQKRVAIIFDRNSFIFTIHLNSCSCKGWCTGLSRTLDIFWSCRVCSWNCWHNSWCVGRIWSNGCSLTISICNRSSCLNSYSFCSTNKVFFWRKCYCSSRWVDSIATFSCYCYSCFISWLTSCWIHQFLACDFSSLIITQIKGWCLGLRNVLNIRRNLVCRSHCDWCDCWCVLSCCSLDVILLDLTIFVSTNWRWQCNFHTFCCTSKAWIWSEGYFTRWRINRISSFPFNCYRWRISSETCGRIHQLSRIFCTWSDCNLVTIWVSLSCVKGRSFFLSRPLNIRRSFVNSFDFNWSDCWNVLTIHGIQLTINVWFLIWEFCWPTSIITVVIWTTDRNTISCSKEVIFRNKFNIDIFTVGSNLVLTLSWNDIVTVPIKSSTVAIFINDVWFYHFVNNGTRIKLILVFSTCCKGYSCSLLRPLRTTCFLEFPFWWVRNLSSEVFHFPWEGHTSWALNLVSFLGNTNTST